MVLFYFISFQGRCQSKLVLSEDYLFSSLYMIFLGDFNLLCALKWLQCTVVSQLSFPVIFLSLFKVSFLNSQFTGNWTPPPRYPNGNWITTGSTFNTVTLCITPWCEIFLFQWKPLPHITVFMQKSYRVPKHFLSLMPISNSVNNML